MKGAAVLAIFSRHSSARPFVELARRSSGRHLLCFAGVAFEMRGAAELARRWSARHLCLLQAQQSSPGAAVLAIFFFCRRSSARHLRLCIYVVSTFYLLLRCIYYYVATTSTLHLLRLSTYLVPTSSTRTAAVPVTLDALHLLLR